MDNDNTRNHNKAANVLATNTFDESLLAPAQFSTLFERKKY